MYFGTYEMEGIEFDYDFDGEKLSLYPKADDLDAVRDLVYERKEEGIGWTVTDKALRIDSGILALVTNRDNERLILFTRYRAFNCQETYKSEGSSITLSIPVDQYFTLSQDRIEKIEFRSPLLNHIYDVREIIKEHGVNFRDSDNSVSSITAEFAPTTIDCGSFQIDDHMVAVTMSTTLHHNPKPGHFPFTAASSLCCSFDSTDDYQFIYELINRATLFLRFCSFCLAASFESIFLQAVNRYKKIDGGYITQTRNIGEFPKAKPPENVPAEFEEGVFISVRKESSFVSSFLKLAGPREIFTWHLPSNFSEYNVYRVPRFSSIAAGFEWEFGRRFPDGIKHKKRHERIVKYLAGVFEEAEKKLGATQLDKKKREEMDWLLEVERDKGSYAAKLHFACKEIPALDALGAWYFERLGLPFKIDAISEKVEDVRDAYAHGNLQYDLDSEGRADIFFLEEVLLSMQLLRMDYGDEEVVLEEVKRICQERG